MFHQLKSLFLRFYVHHFRVIGRGFPIKNNAGQLVGNIDLVERTHNRITFHGWCHADQISLVTNGGGTASVRPHIKRRDVSRAYGGRSDVGFSLAEAIGNGRYTLALDRPQKDMRPLHVQPISRSRRIWGVVRLFARFLLALSAVAPSILNWIIFKDLAARQQVKNMLSLDIQTPKLALDPAYLREKMQQVRRLPPKGKITIILPIYNAFDLLPEVLSRVVNNTDLPWRLILIEDCSTDPLVRPWLRNWVKDQQKHGISDIELIENEQNLGFVQAVNRGLQKAIAFGDHVVLLNADAFVPPQWASRLLEPVFSDATVASTTPLSNDAELFSVPFICKQSSLHAGQAEAIDKVARTLPFVDEHINVPTGVGFCMAMNIAFLRKIPQLDPAFGLGYGEEVDWCQKARPKKGRHVVVPNLFVEHRGGTSFGASKKQALIAKNNAVIGKRYPTYDHEVQQFIKEDPLITPRLMLSMAWAASQVGTQQNDKKLQIYLAHSMGGGADLYLEKRIQADWVQFKLPSIVLRVGGQMRWQIEVIAGEHRTIGMLDSLDDLIELLRPITRRKIVYSCGVGDRDPIFIPKALSALCAANDTTLEILVHDYFMVSPNYTLLNEAGVYEGPKPQAENSTKTPAALKEWQTAWGQLLKDADRICIFSQSSRDILLATYPFARRKLWLQPHDLHTEIPDLSHFGQPSNLGESPRRVIAVLGNIGVHKGAELVMDLANLMAWQSNVSMVVLGDMDPGIPRPKTLQVHGGYDLAILPELVKHYKITDWLIPSIWPETFSYTTHEALATGLPTYAFDLGAQGEAVAQSANGYLIPYGNGRQLTDMAFETLLQPRPDPVISRPHRMAGQR